MGAENNVIVRGLFCVRDSLHLLDGVSDVEISSGETFVFLFIVPIMA